MSAARLTPAMVAALRLASEDEIRYYRGGWYSIPRIYGEDQRPGWAQTSPTEPGCGDGTNPRTLRALVGLGLVVESVGGSSVYRHRWTITDAGRDALAAIDAEGTK